ncbi:hypothetical protein ACIRU8_39450 [Streptomyces sp. NPDC101175]|uniref:hypothetical protein n=1 Tax=Streptomyces sp. NPDC101175 TaxID=3366123 RepID=UPI0038324374
MEKAMAAKRLATIEADIKAGKPLAPSDLRELLEETKRARADSDKQYAEADYWRESYRLTKGLSDDEIGTIIAVRDATPKPHPRPCEFPHEACNCDPTDTP